MPQPIRKPVTTARVKTAKVHEDIRTAKDELHDANKVIAQAAAEAPEEEKVAAAVEQNAAVEAQLHGVVEELKVVTDLLRTAEARGDLHIAGRRSGEGLDSVIEHLTASVQPAAPRP